jgi:large subunit ribosomal protein L15
MLKLNNLNSPKGSHRNVKRIGRGEGSGQGKQAGKGHKGQKARAGGGIRLGFEGGGMPLYMRIPKSGEFSNFVFKKTYVIVKLSLINSKFSSDEKISLKLLKDKGIVKDSVKLSEVKFLKDTDDVRKLVFEDKFKFSESSKKLIISKGGTVSQ